MSLKHYFILQNIKKKKKIHIYNVDNYILIQQPW